MQRDSKGRHACGEAWADGREARDPLLPFAARCSHPGLCGPRAMGWLPPLQDEYHRGKLMRLLGREILRPHVEETYSRAGGREAGFITVHGDGDGDVRCE